MNQNLIVQNYAIEIKTGEHWTQDKIYIYDCTEELSEEEADVIVDYLYQEGFIKDRRTERKIVRGGL